jgi:hypothetical protein
MRIWSVGYALVLVGLLGAGCGSSDTPDKAKAGSATTSAVATQAVHNPEVAGQPQPKLQTLKIWLGPEEMVAELALTDPQVMTGMMFRTHMEENESMLFVFPSPGQRAFWMKNTLLPLSCAYIDPDGVILEEHDMKPKDETPITAGSANVQYVLEVKQGWFQRHNIKVGTQVRTERGTLAETFFRGR